MPYFMYQVFIIQNIELKNIKSILKAIAECALQDIFNINLISLDVKLWIHVCSIRAPFRISMQYVIIDWKKDLTLKFNNFENVKKIFIRILQHAQYDNSI